MPGITVTPSMAFDAVCYFEKRFLGGDNFHPRQLEFIKKMNARCAEFSVGFVRPDYEEYISDSTLCLALSTYENAPFETMTLEELARFFADAEKFRTAVMSKITGEFTAKYVGDAMDYLVEGLSESYVEGLKILSDAGFAEAWKADLLPLILEKTAQKQNVYDAIDFSAIAADIEKLKQCPPIGDVKIYVSALSYPTAFTLHGGAFLENIGGGEGAGMLCHELMHGFATKEVEDMYVRYVKSHPFLAEKHRILIEEMQSGNEEEFVMAAEYFLRLKHTAEPKEELLRKARFDYDDCTPTAVFLFDLLSRETETPRDYNSWLKRVFENNLLPQSDIEKQMSFV